MLEVFRILAAMSILLSCTAQHDRLPAARIVVSGVNAEEDLVRTVREFGYDTRSEVRIRPPESWHGETLIEIHGRDFDARGDNSNGPGQFVFFFYQPFESTDDESAARAAAAFRARLIADGFSQAQLELS